MCSRMIFQYMIGKREENRNDTSKKNNETSSCIDNVSLHVSV